MRVSRRIFSSPKIHLLNIQLLNIITQQRHFTETFLRIQHPILMKSAITPEPALLGFLREEPLHGYDLHKQVSAQLGSVWRLGQSQMYAILKDYAARGWIKTIAAPQNGRPARKMLKLTAAGERAFADWLKQTARGLREFRVDFFARLYFARRAGRPALRALLQHQIAATQKEYDTLTAAEPTSEFDAAVKHFRAAQLHAILEWLAAYQKTELNAAALQKSPTRSKKK